MDVDLDVCNKCVCMGMEYGVRGIKKMDTISSITRGNIRETAKLN